MNQKTERLRIRTKLAFGVGQVAEGIKNTTFGMFVVMYYNQVLGLDPGLAGLAAGIALTFDAVTDPLAGTLSDSLRSPWGRRHPFMVVSALPLALTFFFLFSPPEGLTGGYLFFWLLTMAILVRASMTFYHIPHLALGAELSSHYEERTKVFTYSTMFGFVGAVSMRVGSFPIFFPSSKGGLLNPDAYQPFAIALGIVMLVVILWSAWGTRDRIPYLPQASTKQPFSFGEMFKALYELMRFASFRSLFFGMLITTFIFGIEAFMYTYVGKFFWDLNEEQLGLLGAPMLLGLPLSFVVIPWMTRKLDKRNALITSWIGLMLTANIPIICRLAGVFPDNDNVVFMPLLLVFRLLGSIISPALFIVPQSMFADIGDEVALATGKRVEGLIFSARALIGKATIGFGTMLGGLALKAIEFPLKAVPGEIDPDVIFRLGLVEGPLTSVVSLTGLVFYLRYPLNRRRHEEIRTELAKRAAATQSVDERSSIAE